MNNPIDVLGAWVLRAVLLVMPVLAYAVPILEVDVPGASSTAVTGVNNAGHLVGRYSLTGNEGFIFRAGVLSEIVIPGADQGVFPQSLNNLGQAAGYFVSGTGVIHGFVWTEAGVVMVINPPGSQGTLLMALNDSGDLVGSSTNNNTGFLFRNGMFEEIVIPAAVQGVFPQSINNAGHVAGHFVTATGFIHGFVWNDGNVTVIDPPGSAGTLLTGINDFGDLTGSTINDGAFLFQGSSFDPLNISGAGQGVFPEEINDLGQVAGYYVTDAGKIRGFVTLAAAVPIPSTAYLFALGALLLAAFRIRDRRARYF